MSAPASIPIASSKPSFRDPEPEVVSWLRVVESKVAGLRFGSVLVVVHEGRVTQIESTEKFRFGQRPATDSASPSGQPSGE